MQKMWSIVLGKTQRRNMNPETVTAAVIRSIFNK